MQMLKTFLQRNFSVQFEAFFCIMQKAMPNMFSNSGIIGDHAGNRRRRVVFTCSNVLPVAGFWPDSHL
jgi:hypothetical protein